MYSKYWLVVVFELCYNASKILLFVQRPIGRDLTWGPPTGPEVKPEESCPPLAVMQVVLFDQHPPSANINLVSTNVQARDNFSHIPSRSVHIHMELCKLYSKF